MIKRKLLIILLCGAFLTGLAGCVNPTEPIQTKADSALYSTTTERVASIPSIESSETAAVGSTVVTPATEAKTAEEEIMPETNQYDPIESDSTQQTTNSDATMTPSTVQETERTPVTDSPVSNQPPLEPSTSPQTSTTSKIPATSNTPTTSKMPETSETPTTPKAPVTSNPPETSQAPTPHTHNWSEWRVAQAATCTSAGSQRRTCNGCSEVQTQTTPATGHSFGAWKVLSEPTTEKTGVEQRTCSSCGVNELRSLEKFPKPEGTFTDTEWMAQRFLELLNENRAKVGAQQLVTSDKMHEMALVRAEELTVFFSHYRPNMGPQVTIGTEQYTTIFDDFEYGIFDGTYSENPATGELKPHYRREHSGEDIGQTGISEDSTAEEAIQNMMEGFRGSPGHWNDLMDTSYGAVGIAVSVERIDMGEGFPALYRYYFEVLLTDRLYE